MIDLSRMVLLAAVMLSLAGCSRSSAQVAAIQSGEQSYHLGRKAYERNNYESAARYFSEAVGWQGLNADLAAEATLLRAKSYIKLGRLEEAMRDLNDARNSPVPQDEVLLAKAEIAVLQKDLPRARSLYEKARKVNPAVVVPNSM